MHRALLAALLSLAPALTAQTPFGVPNQQPVVESGVLELQLAMRARLISCEQLVQTYLDRIDAYDQQGPLLNSFLYVNPRALEEARMRDAQRARGGAVGPLFGIPVVLKDNVDTGDMPTTAGSVALAGSIPPDDAFIVQRLRAAGAIVIGKASLTEFANFLTTGMPNGYCSLGGYGANPYEPARNPNGRPRVNTGGSSSGPGIAVAASLATVGIGTETSGSILSPSSQNGLVGIKPTVGLVSRDGIVPITADQDTAGPMCRTVTDAAILLSVIAGYDPADPATAACLIPGNCPPDYTVFLDKHALRGARIAVPRSPYWNGIPLVRRQVLENAIDAMRAAGAEIIDPFAIPQQGPLSGFGICTSYPPPQDCSSVLLYGFKRDLNTYLAGLGPMAPVRSLADVIAFNNANAAVALMFGQRIALAAEQMDTSPGSTDTQRYLFDRARDLQLARGALDAAHAGADGIPGTADDIDAIVYPANNGADAPARAGYPSIIVPAGLVPAVGTGLNQVPLGITLSGQAFSEPRLIALAYALEQATMQRPVPMSTPILNGSIATRPSGVSPLGQMGAAALTVLDAVAPSGAIVEGAVR